MAYRFVSDDRNRIIVINASLGESGNLKKFLIDGSWSLPDENTLKFSFSGNRSSFTGDSLIFRGNIEKITGSSLLFRARASDTLSGMRTSSIELRGTWQADRSNRLVFRVAKSGGTYDILRLSGEWKVNNNNEIVYRYVRTEMKTKTKSLKSLVFRGFWDLGEDRIVYRIEGNDKSFFKFKASLQSASLRAASGKIKYQIGVDTSKRSVRGQKVMNVTIFGRWKLSRAFSVEFDVFRDGKTGKGLKFAAEKVVARKNFIRVSLQSLKGKSLGTDVSFSRKVSDNLEFFSSLAGFSGEIKVEFGIKGKF